MTNFLNKFVYFIKEKRVAAPILLLALVFLLFPLKAHALVGWLIDLGTGLATALPAAFITLVLSAIAWVTGLFAALSGEILDWVFSGSFIQLSYTNPENNQLLQIGLDITRPFANMLLVVFLVVIALSIALRIGEYGSKKTFAKLILVALLVNFSTVFLGIIVDAANIIMNFFIQGITGGDRLLASWKAVWENIVKHFGSRSFVFATGQAESMMRVIAVIFINISLFLVLLLWAFLFIARYIAIWFLVILSPLAFVCFILPATKRIWSLWWDQFTKWVMIGVNAVFFLYLADQFALINPTENVNFGTLGGALLPTIFPIAVYWAGLIIAVGKLPAEAAAIKGLTTRGGKWVGGKAWRGVRTWAEEKGGVREKVGTALRAVEKVPVARVFLPEAVRKYGEFRPAIEAGKTEAGTYSSRVIAGRIATGADYGVKAVGGMLQLVERGDMQDFFKAFKDKYKVETEADLYKIPEFRDKVGRLLQVGIRGGLHNPILRSDPRMARIAFETGLAGYTANELQADNFEGSTEGAVAKATSEARPPHMKNWEREVVQDKTIITQLMQRGRDVWEELPRVVKRGQETTLDTVRKILDDFAKATPGLAGKSREEIWDAYKAANPNQKPFFAYVDTNRAIEQGWAIERTDKETYEDEKTGKIKTRLKEGGVPRPFAPPPAPGAPPAAPPPVAPPATPGAAAGLSPRPPRGRPGVGGPPPQGRPTRRPRGRPGVGGP